MYIYPIDQTKVSRAFGEVPTGYGGEFFDEVYEILRDFTKGFTYYKRQRPGQTEKQLKTSYVVKVDSGQVAGLDQDAVFGAGVYPTGVRGECSDSPAKTLYDNPSPEALKTFVRCAADRYARRSDYRFLRGPEYRWRDIAVYILSTRLRYRWDHLRQRADRSQPIYQSIFDGNSYASSDVRLRPYRWLDDTDLKRTTDGQRTHRAYKIIEVGKAMGERFVYYKARDGQGRMRRRVDFLKRIPALPSNGGPRSLLVGSGYFLPDGEKLPAGDCVMPRRHLTAAQVETRDDLEAFVQNAACYIRSQGLQRARSEFRKTKWFDKDRNIYIYVEGNKPTAAEAMVYVFPPDPTKEARVWGNAFIDKFGNSYYPETHRILSQYGSGWTYYSSTSGGQHREDYKAGYMVEVSVGSEKITVGSGLYEADTPIACRDTHRSARRVVASEVLALARQNAIGDATLNALQSFVRCAALEIEDRMHSTLPIRFLPQAERLRAIRSGLHSFSTSVRALNQLRSWGAGSDQDIYLFGYEHPADAQGISRLDSDYATSENPVASNGEWGRIRYGRYYMGPERRRGGTRNNMLRVVNDFGGAFVYSTDADGKKTISFVNRVYNNDGALRGLTWQNRDSFGTPPVGPDFYIGASIKWAE